MTLLSLYNHVVNNTQAFLIFLHLTPNRNHCWMTWTSNLQKELYGCQEYHLCPQVTYSKIEKQLTECLHNVFFANNLDRFYSKIVPYWWMIQPHIPILWLSWSTVVLGCFESSTCTWEIWYQCCLARPFVLIVDFALFRIHACDILRQPQQVWCQVEVWQCKKLVSCHAPQHLSNTLNQKHSLDLHQIALCHIAMLHQKSCYQWSQCNIPSSCVCHEEQSTKVLGQVQYPCYGIQGYISSSNLIHQTQFQLLHDCSTISVL